MTIWTASILTIFPDMFPGPLGMSLAGRALRDGQWRIETTDIRDFAFDERGSVDDTPAGGGPGMIMRADVLARAIDHVTDSDDDQRPLICLSARGAPLKQARVRELAQGPGVIVLSGRFEGIDERLMAARQMEEISLGDFILSGGEIAALALIDACVRLRPGIMGRSESGHEESFENGLLEYPQYTKPRIFEKCEIPSVLTSGDHRAVARWRHEQAKKITYERRPDLWEAYLATNPLPDQSSCRIDHRYVRDQMSKHNTDKSASDGDTP